MKISPIEGLTVLITGGACSFGIHFIETAFRLYAPKRIIVYSRDEWKHALCREKFRALYDANKLEFFVGDVRDFERLTLAMRADVDVVIHAAALKRIDAVEYSPYEAVQTNIMGSWNVFRAAIEAKVAKVVALSTDKAADALNTYGVSKLMMERLCVQSNSYAGSGPTRLSCTRYGNVAGSRGSVIPLFRHQAATTGVLKVTDPAMTRFWMTLDDSVNLVHFALQQMRGGEVFIPLMRAFKLEDLAEAVAKEANLSPNTDYIRIVGPGPGEKLHESIVSPYERPYCRCMYGNMILYPLYCSWSEVEMVGWPVKDNYRYLSSDVANKLSVEELYTALGEVEK